MKPKQSNKNGEEEEPFIQAAILPPRQYARQDFRRVETMVPENSGIGINDKARCAGFLRDTASACSREGRRAR